MTGREIVDAVVNEGGFDTSSTGVSRATVLGWVRARYDDLVARSRWRQAIVELGTTVAEQDTYTLSDEIVEVDELRIRGGRRYRREGTADVWDLQSGDLVRSSAGSPIFAPHFDDAGAPAVILWPAPEDDGDVIEGLCALLPVAFEDSEVFTPVVPRDFHRDLVRAASIEGKRLVEEIDGDEGDEWWLGRVEALRRRRNSRIGQGPQTMKIFRRPR